MAIASFVVFVTVPAKTSIYAQRSCWGNCAVHSLYLNELAPEFASRYSNTLLVTFNNRIALRNMNKDHAYGSGKSGGMRVSDRPMVFAAIDLESFRAAPNGSIEGISGAESFEFKKTAYASKARPLVPGSEAY
ncbi:hypothetical protein HYPSUDRAFT_206520 [Hypholoma sublateritium FD-334 SS-4]|uniref:Uncharacterized protein n=1 Tax=Hypholoma sublateritium (strain FD-334 SS-4) TaxID=945553 RepID=A0A0D2NDA0_HYPSF|nr:hypothetical protein HYPSUDRAFT_206520 [Hypholoma sublateritium FD-334 SS-4]